jgi:TonB family protein
MIAYVFLLAAATPANKVEVPVPAYAVTCPDGSTAYNLVECPIPPPPSSNAVLRPVAPLNYPGSWVTTNDYPATALRQEIEGTASFIVSVNANGVVASCRITGSSGSSVLDEATCVNVTKRARFQPATDKNGKPISSTYANRVTWRIPDYDPSDYDVAADYGDDTQSYPRAPRSVGYLVPPSDVDYPAAAKAAREQGFVNVDLVVDEQGKVASCAIGKGSGSTSLDAASCPFITTKWSFQPALDFDGNPTKGKVSQRLSWYLPSPPTEAYPEPAVRPRKPEKNLFIDPGKMTLQFDLDVEGRPVNCTSGTEGLQAIVKEMRGPFSGICSIFTEGPRNVVFEPFLDAAGKPVGKTVLVEVQLSHPTKAEPATK